MRADVVERADLVVLDADDHERGGPHSDIADDPVAWIGDLRRFRDVQPDPAKNLLFRFETILGVVNTQVDLTSLRSEEHTSELQSLMRISYAVFCLKKKKSKTVKNN